MKNKYLKGKSHFLWIHLKANLILILVFIAFIVLTVYTSFKIEVFSDGFEINNVTYGKGIYVAPTIFNWSDNEYSDYGGEAVATSVSSLLVNFVYSAPLIVLIGLFTLILINIIIIKDANVGYLSFWMTTSLSRKEIISLKIIFLLIANFFMSFSCVIVVLIYGSMANDSGLYMKNIIFYSFQFILFNLFLTLLILSITYFYYEKIISFNIIVMFFFIFLLIVYALDMLYRLYSEDKILKNFKFASFISPMSLIYSTLHFDFNNTTDFNCGSIGEYEIVKTLDNKFKDNTFCAIVFPLIITTLTGSCFYWNIYKFKKMQFSF